MKRPSETDILALIDALGKEQPKRPPGKGWQTVLQMAMRKGISKSSMRQRIETAIANGAKLERFTGSDYDANGKLVKQTWLRAL